MCTENRYNWYEVDFTRFLLSLELPVYKKEMALKDILEGEKRTFDVQFDEMILRNKFRRFSDTFYDKLAANKTSIMAIFDLLCEVINQYDNADMANAQNTFDRLMEDLQDHLFISNVFWLNYSPYFYRIRVSTSEKLNKPRDLFHIPYNKRYLVSNERYSLAGHPCLYLASCLEIAWQECGYPKDFYYAKFEYQAEAIEQNEWKLMTFLSPRDVARKWFIAMNSSEECYFKIATDYLVSYPLIYACSIVNPTGHSAFKQEFIIPQMLMQWVYRHYDKIKGIRYFSCYNVDDIRCYNGFNVVMPAKRSDNRSQYSRDLKKKFKVTKPKHYKIQFSDTTATTVQAFKIEMTEVMKNTFLQAGSCMMDMYYVTDELDKAIKYIDDSDTRLIVSTLRAVVQSGKMLLEKHRKEVIIESYRTSSEYFPRDEDKIEIFSKIYDRFKTEVIETAHQFLIKLNTIDVDGSEVLYTIS